jgi:hypothetical protein
MSYPFPVELQSQVDKAQGKTPVQAPPQQPINVLQPVNVGQQPTVNQSQLTQWDIQNNYPGDAAAGYYTGGSRKVNIGNDDKQKPQLVDITAAKTLYPSFNKDMKRYIRNALTALGVKRPSQSQIESFVGNVMEYSSAQAVINSDARAWYEFIPEYVSAYQKEAGGGGGGGGPTRAVNFTDPGTAKSLLNNALQTYLGRKAEPAEIRDFVQALNKAEARNPQVVSRSGSTQVASGGFNPSTFAEDYAAGMQGAGEYQAVTGVLDSLINSLRAPVEAV